MEMSLETKTKVEVNGQLLPDHLLQNFEKAARNLRGTSGEPGPTVYDLLRIWLAEPTSWEIQSKFREYAEGETPGIAQPNEDGIFDEDSFEM